MPRYHILCIPYQCRRYCTFNFIFTIECSAICLSSFAFACTHTHTRLSSRQASVSLARIKKREYVYAQEWKQNWKRYEQQKGVRRSVLFFLLAWKIKTHLNYSLQLVYLFMSLLDSILLQNVDTSKCSNCIWNEASEL